MAGTTRVAVAEGDEDWHQVGRLVRAYIGSLGFDIRFQGPDAELADLAASYGPPAGAALLAWVDGRPVGVTGVRRLDAGPDAELKRMFVEPAARGLGLGRVLGEAAIEQARGLGYRRLLLDSRASLVAACALYRRLGFVEVPPYRHNPFDDAVYMALEL